MKKMFKGFAAGIVVILVVVAPACRSSKKRNPQPSTTAVATDTVPDVPTTATADTRVEQPRDFVNPSADDPRTTAELLPADIESLNRVVQQRGFIRDAFFGYDESSLSDQAQAALSSSASWLRQNAVYNVLVEGHCDERGTEQYNLALGDRRASIVRDYLVTLGVDAGRIRTVSYGEERPFDDGHDESSWAQNRRAHLVLVAR